MSLPKAFILGLMKESMNELSFALYALGSRRLSYLWLGVPRKVVFTRILVFPHRWVFQFRDVFILREDASMGFSRRYRGKAFPAMRTIILRLVCSVENTRNAISKRSWYAEPARIRKNYATTALHSA